ncbi:Nicotinate-nucleotide--dimethylbenzimidazole phosphoribosyltransferase [compost metagenome]
MLLDGYAAAAAAAVLHALDPALIAHCQAGHVGTATGHARLLDALGKRPLIALDITEEEGVGGVTALALVRLACEVR